ncbi:cytochrome b reductase 1-like protein [Sarcoptes scabiei]|uniref:Cytochrome b reductase 1-like protein n=1 Tax=Sarcoptes scabiei TaxID=52283 RepID=A0A132A838_SARSC|nr:cytochrome b reductase 1-like protein [Sarcoptes scabiei]
MTSNSDYRSTISTSFTKSIITNTTSYQFTTSSYTITTSTSPSNQSSTILGIHSQPYRNYLTERNHFYHSASQPTTFTTTSSSSLRPSTIISSIQDNQQQQHHSPTRELIQQSSVPKNQQSLFSALGIHKLSKTGSKQSINSQASNNHNNNKMAANNKNRSTSSLAVDGTYNVKSSIENIDDDDDYDIYPRSACSKFLYGFLWLLAQLGLFGAITALVYWFFKYDKGFAYQNDKPILIYKTYLCCKKIYNKIAHAFFFVISIGLVSFGFLLGFQAQSIASSPDQQVQHFYSLHSWIGLVACALFALQFFFGFITFLVLLCCDRSTAGYRARFLPTHITFGVVIFVLACAACLSGLLQMARSRLAGPSLTEPIRADYRDMRVEDFNIFMNAGIVINLVGACLILLIILIPYLVYNFRNR